MPGHGEWKTVGKKKKRDVRKMEATWGRIDRRNKDGESSGATSSRELHQRRLNEGRCLECGQAGHYRASCPTKSRSRGHGAGNSVSGTRTASGRSGNIAAGPRTVSKAGAAAPTTSNGGAKRPRTDERTGLTPEAKAARRYQPAPRVTWGQITLVVLHKDNTALKWEENEDLKKKFDDHLAKILNKNEPIPIVDSWTWEAPRVVVKLPSIKDVEAFRSGLTNCNVLTLSQWEEMEERSHRFHGKLGKSASSFSDETLAKLVKRMKETKGIRGRLEYCRRVTKNLTTGDIIEIKVDDSAMEEWKAADFTLHIGATGLVKFIEKGADKTKVLEKKVNEVESTIEARREELRNLQTELVKLKTEKEATTLAMNISMAADDLGEDGKTDESVDAEKSARTEEHIKKIKAARLNDDAWRACHPNDPDVAGLRAEANVAGLRPDEENVAGLRNSSNNEMNAQGAGSEKDKLSDEPM